MEEERFSREQKEKNLMDAELAFLRQKEQYAAQVHEAELAFWRRKEENAAQLHQKNQIKLELEIELLKKKLAAFDAPVASHSE